MKREIENINPNGEIILILYRLCSTYRDQMQALLDENLKVTKLDNKTYHFSYFETEFDFGIYKTKEEIKESERWLIFASKKFLETYKMVIDYWDENEYMIAGYVNSFQDGKKVLNSWLEVEIDGNLYVKDINRNLIMKKEDYEKIFMPIEIMRKYKETKEQEKVLVQKRNA